MNQPAREAANERATAFQRSELTSLCVVTAAEVEFRAVAGLLGAPIIESREPLRLCRGRRRQCEITLLISEVGASGFAQRLAHHLAATRYDALLVIGLAGGLDPQLGTGEVVVYDSCFAANPGRLDSAPATIGREKRLAREEFASLDCHAGLSERVLTSLRAGGLKGRRGTGLTGDRVIVNAAEKRVLWERYGASVVDMETYQILSACAQFNLPATAVRIVSDEADQDLPDFNQAIDRAGKIVAGRAALALLGRPAAAIRFLFSLRRVMKSLRQAADLILNGTPARLD